MGVEGVDLEIVGVLGCDELAGDDGAGETGFGPGEVVFGFFAYRFGRALRAGGYDSLVRRDADVHVGGEAVGEEAGLRHGEPAAGVEQDGNGVCDLDELDAVDGAGFGGGGAGVVEGPGGGGAFEDGLGEGETDRVLGGEALGGEGVAGGVGGGGDGESVVELEGGGGEVFDGGEGDFGGDGEGAGGGNEVRVDDVGGDLELGVEGCGR